LAGVSAPSAAAWPSRRAAGAAACGPRAAFPHFLGISESQTQDATADSPPRLSLFLRARASAIMGGTKAAP
jgi:hypothetical protein